jgi:hypothetical protein
MITTLEINGAKHEIAWPIPDGLSFEGNSENEYYLTDGRGGKFAPSWEAIFRRLSSERGVNFDFEVMYIGQAFGQDGTRNVLDRLIKHETLQKIAIQGTLSQFKLTLLLLEVVMGNTVMTVFSPKAEITFNSIERFGNGLDKLRRTTEVERIAIYEASLIRYFQPKFNKEFKDSFPSTNMKLLEDCYKKDFSAVCAKIYFDDFPFRLFSTTVKPAPFHIAFYDLHTDARRKLFYMGE